MAASKATDSVVERRLRPIYDAIDSNNNKKAIQEADKVLKKHPATMCAKALKALALIRSGRQDDAFPLIDYIEQHDELNDDTTLQALSHCLREVSAPQRIAQLYERVCKKHPKNEQFLTHLFMAYARIRDYQKQQKTAMLLYKEFPKNPYYFWSVMSIVMQALNDPNLAKSMYYPLAEKMVLKNLESNNSRVEAEVNLYVLILEGQGKYDEAVKVFEGPLHEEFIATNYLFFLHRTLLLRQKAHQHRTVVQMCIESIPDNSDDWTLWTLMFTSAMILIKENRQDESEIVELMTRLVIDETDRCNRIATGADRIRGPYLARFHLIICLLKAELIVRAELGTSQLGEPVDLICEYLSYFAAKPCCFVDLRPMLGLLNEHQIRSLFDKRIQEITLLPYICGCDRSAITYAANSSDVQRHITCLQLARACGLHKCLDINAKIRFIDELLLRMKRATDAEFEFADDYGMMAIQLLWSIYVETGDIDTVHEIVILLDWMRQLFPSNPHFRLLIAKCYAMLGACSLVIKTVQSLDIKYMQRDTLAYLLFDVFINFGRFDNAVAYYAEMNMLFEMGEREVSECLTTAYKNGKFMTIPQLVEFADCWRFSLHATGADVNSRYLAAVFTADSVEMITDRLVDHGQPIIDTIDWTTMRDNRDLRLITLAEPDEYRLKADEHIKLSFQETLDWLRIKQLILHCLATICAHNTNRTASLALANGQLKAHYAHCCATYGTERCSLVMCLEMPAPANLALFVTGGYMDVLLAVIDTIVDATSTIENANNIDNSSSSQQSSTDVESSNVSILSVDQLQHLIQRMFANHQLHCIGQTPLPSSCNGTNNRVVSFPHMQLAHCSWLLQTTSTLLWLFKLVGRRLPTTSKKSRKNRSDESPTLTRLAELTSVVAALPSAIDRLLVDLETMLNVETILSNWTRCSMQDNDDGQRSSSTDQRKTTTTTIRGHDQELDTILDDIQKKIAVELHSSYKESISEMRTFASKLSTMCQTKSH